MKECVICSVAESKYRCPACRSLYCSVACSKAHKASGECTKVEGAVRPPPVPCTVTPSSGAAAAVVATVPRPVARPEEALTEFLSAAQKSALAADEDVRGLVRSKRLRDQLERVNSAPDRQAELKKARLIPEFEKFVSKMLHAIHPEPALAGWEPHSANMPLGRCR